MNKRGTGNKEKKNKDVPEELVASKDLEGKKIIDEQGKVIGRVQNVHIDPITFNVKGLSVDHGAFHGSHFIDSSYIGSISEEGVVLLSAPIHQQYFDEIYE